MRKQKNRLYSCHDACIKALWTGDDREWQELHNHNRNVLLRYFNKLLAGSINIFYTKTREVYRGDEWIRITAWHRSTRPGVNVQESHMWLRNGEIIPTYHHDINTFEDLFEHGDYTVGVCVKTA